MKKIIFATKNKGKFKELKSLFFENQLNFELISLNDLEDVPEIYENGKSFKENAYIKARTIFDKYKIPVIGDDSGIIAEALGNEPGIYSARYAGENATDEENNKKLIKMLKNFDNKNAFFQCVLCFIDKNGKEYYTEGKCKGIIIDTPRGENGFGYDPIFYIPELGKTIAELNMSEKNKISHRAKAFNNLVKLLKEIKDD